MSSVPVWHKIKTFVCPSGKRRRVKRTASHAAQKSMPPKPVYPPKPVRAPIAALPAPERLDILAIEQRIMDQVAAGRVGEMVRDFGELYRTSRTYYNPSPTGRRSIEPPAVQYPPRDNRPDPTPEPVTRVILHSNNPEIDQAIVAGTSWLPKVLIRPETVKGLTPVAVPSLGTTGMRLTLPNPVSAPVSDRTPISGVVVSDTVPGSATAVMERENEETQDLLITDEWRSMFRTETAHVCRACLKYGRGVVEDDGQWICGRCLSAGRY